MLSISVIVACAYFGSSRVAISSFSSLSKERIHRRFIALRFIGSRMPGATDRQIGARFLGNCSLVTSDVTIGRRAERNMGPT